MRIMIWQESFWPNIGGAEVMVTKLLMALRRRGYEFIVVTRQDGSDKAAEDQFNGIPVYRFPFWNVLAERDTAKVIELRKSIALLKRSFTPDLVHVNCFGPSCFFHLDTVNAHAGPFVVTLHSKNNLSAQGTARQFLRSASWLVGCSGAILDYVRQLVPEMISRSSIIYNGLETPTIAPDPLPFDPPRLLCLGRVVGDKGFDLALSAFASLAPRFPGMRLTVAGDGPARGQLEARASALGVSDRVDFTGWVTPDRVLSLINASTVVLMPSQHEAFPLVALEASAMGRPVVATRTGGFSEIVLHGRTGILVDRGDPRALAGAVGVLLNDPQIAGHMGQAARSRVLSVFSFDKHVDAYDQLYCAIVADWRQKEVALTQG